GGRPVRALEHVAHAPGVPGVPLRDRDDALPAKARIARPLAHALDDPARQLHDEAERRRRDAPGDVAGGGSPPPVRAGRAGARLPRAVRHARALAGRDYRLPRRLAAAERGLAGRILGTARHPRLARVAERAAPGRVPDPAVGA